MFPIEKELIFGSVVKVRVRVSLREINSSPCKVPKVTYNNVYVGMCEWDRESGGWHMCTYVYSSACDKVI